MGALGSEELDAHGRADGHGLGGNIREDARVAMLLKQGSEKDVNVITVDYKYVAVQGCYCHIVLS